LEKKVASSIRAHEGMSILELRKQVSDQLKNLDPRQQKPKIQTRTSSNEEANNPASDPPKR
jgi:hypothetical protein